MSSDRRLTKSLNPLIIIEGGRWAFFTCVVGASELFTSESGFGVFLSTSIGSVCDNTSNRFLNINNFLFLLIIWVGELGSEELECFLFSDWDVRPTLFGFFEFVRGDGVFSPEFIAGLTWRALCILFVLLLLVFFLGDLAIFVLRTRSYSSTRRVR